MQIKAAQVLVVGATKEDYEYMGVEPTKVKDAQSLNNIAKKKGGSLNMKDLMDLAGQ